MSVLGMLPKFWHHPAGIIEYHHMLRVRCSPPGPPTGSLGLAREIGTLMTMYSFSRVNSDILTHLGGSDGSGLFVLFPAEPISPSRSSDVRLQLQLCIIVTGAQGGATANSLTQSKACKNITRPLFGSPFLGQPLKTNDSSVRVRKGKDTYDTDAPAFSLKGRPENRSGILSDVWLQ